MKSNICKHKNFNSQFNCFFFSLEGIFYLETNPEPVFSQGKPGIWNVINKSEMSNYSLMSRKPSNIMDIVNKKLEIFEENQPKINTDEFN